MTDIVQMIKDREAELEEIVREREDYNGKHQRCCIHLEQLREAAADFAELVFVDRYSLDDIAVHRSYEALRKAIFKVPT